MKVSVSTPRPASAAELRRLGSELKQRVDESRPLDDERPFDVEDEPEDDDSDEKAKQAIAEYLSKPPPESVTRLPDGRSTVQLQCPLRDGEDVIEHLTVCRPLLRHVRETERSRDDTGKALRLIAAMSGVPFQPLLDMDAADFELLSLELAYYGKKTPGPGTGKTS